MGRRSFAGRPDRRELVRVDALDVRLEPTTAKVQDVAGLEIQVDPVARWQGVDEIGQELGRHRRRAVGLDLARDPVGDPDLEVRGGQLEPGIFRLEQDVGQDRQRAPVGNGAADDRQAACQVFLHDRKFHVGLTPRCVGSKPRIAAGGSGRRSGRRGQVRRPLGSRRVGSGGYLLSIFSSRHHRHNGVDSVEPHAPAR
jgi:hypothetical protein